MGIQHCCIVFVASPLTNHPNKKVVHRMRSSRVSYPASPPVVNHFPGRDLIRFEEPTRSGVSVFGLYPFRSLGSSMLVGSTMLVVLTSWWFEHVGRFRSCLDFPPWEAPSPCCLKIAGGPPYDTRAGRHAKHTGLLKST